MNSGICPEIEGCVMASRLGCGRCLSTALRRSADTGFAEVHAAMRHLDPWSMRRGREARIALSAPFRAVVEREKLERCRVE